MPQPSICILRLSAIGDVTHVLPVVNAIRSQLPKAHITWIIGKLEARLLAQFPDIEFIVFNKNGGFKAIKELRQTLKGRQFDVLLQMQVAARANLLSMLIKAPIRIGWDKPRWRDQHQWFINRSVRSLPYQHQVDGFLEFALALLTAIPDANTGELASDTDYDLDLIVCFAQDVDPEAKACTPCWNLPISDADQQWADATLAEATDAGKPILMISPCSSHPLRNWPADRYAKVADYAIERSGMRVVLVGGPSDLEKETGEAIESAMQHNVQNLIGKDTLTQSVALLNRATIVLSPDSGPAHLASAIGTPVLGLYAATPSARSGPYNSLDLCVDKYTEAALKFRQKQPDELRWGQRIEEPGVMDLIGVEEVTAKLDAFIRNK